MTTAFVEDYTYLREAGLDHHQIAQRLGVQRESLLRRTFRNHCYIPEPQEIPAIRKLDQLIAAGEPFYVKRHFAMWDQAIVCAVIKRARHQGRITQVGTMYDGKHHNRIWQPTQSLQEVA